MKERVYWASGAAGAGVSSVVAASAGASGAAVSASIGSSALVSTADRETFH